MSQDFSDDSGKIWTPSNALQITTPDQFKFGTQSFLANYPGSISTPAHSDFTTLTGNFTWETWIRWSAGNEYFYVYQEVNPENLYEWYIGQNGKIEFASWRTGYNQYISISLDPWATFNLNRWYHVAVERIGDDGWIFVDGVPQTQDNYFDAGASVTYLSVPILMGYQCSVIYVDETRFSNIARYPTGGFTPSSSPFTLDANTKVLLHYEPYVPPVETGLGQVILWKRKGV